MMSEASQSCVVTYNGVVHVFKKPVVSMSPRMFNDYCWFVVKANNNGQKTEVPIESLALAWVYKKHIGTEYDPAFEVAIARMRDI